MLSLSSTNPSAWSSSLGRPAGQVAAPQPQAGMLAGLAGVAAATEQVSPESSDDGQDDHMPAEMSFTSISSLSSLSTSYGKPATAAAGEQHFPAQGPAQRACQLPKLNTSFSHVPASSSSAPSHQNHLYASPLDCSKPLSSATSMRNRSLKPTASLSFADSLSSWSMDCMGPPLEDSASHNEPASHFKPHKADSSMRNVPDIAFPPTPPPESRPRVVRQQSQARPPPRAPALEQQQIDPSDALWDQHKASFLDSLVGESLSPQS